MRLRPGIIAAVLASLAVAGCGGSIDDAKLEAELEKGIERQAGVKIASVSCPEGRALKQGDVFNCTATTTGGDRHTIKVTQRDDKGNVGWEVVQS